METNLCVAGFGGQGIMTLGKFLADTVCHRTEKNVTFFPSYGAEQRGGTANCYVVISDGKIGAPLGEVMDELIIMNEPSLKKFLKTLKSGGTLFLNNSLINCEVEREDITLIEIPATQMALEIGNIKVLNIVMLGVYIGYTGILSEEAVWKTIEENLSRKASLLPLNKKAYEAGLAYGRERRGK
ncbi:MAG: pyruvate ferredoxin oxidoreductase [Eubacteriaceae bacterium]|nr:pyruvate ferredoxin oxidoreductase [Eubacteriaceae bacterium]